MSALCAACGMCCNGTLFRYVSLAPGERERLEQFPQLTFRKVGAEMTFDLACGLHTGTACSIHDQRPKTCRSFDCGVLLDVQEGTKSFAEGLLLIAQAKALVADVQRYVAIEPGMPMSVSDWADAPEDIDEEPRRAWDRVVYHLHHFFLRNWREGVLPPA